MSLLTPIGLLGLIGIIALIIIYIIKPNYQNKFIPSTYIWKLSLKYRKKRIPINKLRDILIFLCQVAILTAAAFILAQPFIDQGEEVETGETIIILDTSASMHTEISGKTRFERAIAKALAEATTSLEEGNKVSVILAGDTASFLVRQVGTDQSELVFNAFTMLSETPEDVLCYVEPDVSGAMSLAEQITSITEKVSVTFYTDMKYYATGDVNVVNDFTDINEYNAAILDVRTTVVENYYRIEIDVACYGKDEMLDVVCEIYNANAQSGTLLLDASVSCTGDEVKTIVFAYIPPEGSGGMSEAEKAEINQKLELFSFSEIHVYLNEADSLDYDNDFRVYGGQKPVLDVLYYSAKKNPFFSTALLVLQDIMRSDYEVKITEMNYDNTGKTPIPVEGYDIYIFEEKMPKALPADGVVFCINPDVMPSSSGIKFSGYASSSKLAMASAADSHDILKGADVTKIGVSMFKVVSDPGDYTTLATVSDRTSTYPIMLIKDEVDEKVVVLPFSLHFSNLSILPEFPLMLMNAVTEFFPLTVDKYVYETGDVVSLQARAEELWVSGPGISDLTLTDFPSAITVAKPGTYEFSQYPLSGNLETDKIYVHIPGAESNINLTNSSLTNPDFYQDTDAMDIDLLFYFALSMVALLFFEWWLKSREQI